MGDTPINLSVVGTLGWVGAVIAAASALACGRLPGPLHLADIGGGVPDGRSSLPLRHAGLRVFLRCCRLARTSPTRDPSRAGQTGQIDRAGDSQTGGPAIVATEIWRSGRRPSGSGKIHPRAKEGIHAMTLIDVLLGITVVSTGLFTGLLMTVLFFFERALRICPAWSSPWSCSAS